jgi:hypothetical protein
MMMIIDQWTMVSWCAGSRSSSQTLHRGLVIHTRLRSTTQRRAAPIYHALAQASRSRVPPATQVVGSAHCQLNISSMTSAPWCSSGTNGSGLGDSAGAGPRGAVMGIRHQGSGSGSSRSAWPGWRSSWAALGSPKASASLRSVALPAVVFSAVAGGRWCAGGSSSAASISKRWLAWPRSAPRVSRLGLVMPRPSRACCSGPGMSRVCSLPSGAAWSSGLATGPAEGVAVVAARAVVSVRLGAPVASAAWPIGMVAWRVAWRASR